MDAIVDAAARILEGAGRAGYTTNAIAERAGVSIGSLYQYFPHNDAIAFAIAERERRLLFEELRAAAAEPDWLRALDRLVEAAVRHQLDRPLLARVLDEQEGRLPGTEGIVDVIREVVETVDPAVDFAPRATVVADIIGITHGITDVSGIRGETDADALAARLERAILGYLGPPRS